MACDLGVSHFIVLLYYHAVSHFIISLHYHEQFLILSYRYIIMYNFPFYYTAILSCTLYSFSFYYTIKLSCTVSHFISQNFSFNTPSYLIQYLILFSISVHPLSLLLENTNKTHHQINSNKQWIPKLKQKQPSSTLITVTNNISQLIQQRLNGISKLTQQPTVYLSLHNSNQQHISVHTQQHSTVYLRSHNITNSISWFSHQQPTAKLNWHKRSM